MHRPIAQQFSLTTLTRKRTCALAISLFSFAHTKLTRSRSSLGKRTRLQKLLRSRLSSLTHEDSQRLTNTHKDSRRLTNTHSRRLTHSLTKTHSRRLTKTHKDSRTLTKTHEHSRILTHEDSLTKTHEDSLTHSRRLTHEDSRRLTHEDSRRLTHSLTHSLTKTHSLSPTHRFWGVDSSPLPPTLSPTHTQQPDPSRSFALARTYENTSTHCFITTESP